MFQLAEVLQSNFQERTEALVKLQKVIKNNLDYFTAEKNMDQCCKLKKKVKYDDVFKTEVSVPGNVCAELMHTHKEL